MAFRPSSRQQWLVVAAAVTLAGAVVAARQTQDQGQALYRPGPGVTNPVLVSRVDPQYTEAARLGGIQGSVNLEVVVRRDGTVGDVKVVKSVGAADLDAQAVEAARQWTFMPALVGGAPVDILITMVMEFRLAPSARSTTVAARGGEFEPGAAVMTAGDLEHPEGLLSGFADGAHASSQPGLVVPVPIDVPLPAYTAVAMRARVQGTVRVEIVVAPDGRVNRARVTQSLDPADGLDASALRAALDSKFTAGTIGGKPVAVLMTLDENFRLH